MPYLNPLGWIGYGILVLLFGYIRQLKKGEGQELPEPRYHLFATLATIPLQTYIF